MNATIVNTNNINISALDAIRNRVSIRSYTSEPVSQEEVLEAIALAGNAPSAFNLQPWQFFVATDNELKQALQTAAFGQPQVGSAPVVLALVSDMEDTMAHLEQTIHPGLPDDKKASSLEYLQQTFGAMTQDERKIWGRNQANIALGYLLVGLEALGYGSSPMLGFDPDRVRGVLGIPAHAEIVALVAFGRPAEAGFPKYRHDPQAITHFVQPSVAQAA